MRYIAFFCLTLLLFCFNASAATKTEPNDSTKPEDGKYQLNITFASYHTGNDIVIKQILVKAVNHKNELLNIGKAYNTKSNLKTYYQIEKEFSAEKILPVRKLGFEYYYIICDDSESRGNLKPLVRLKKDSTLYYIDSRNPYCKDSVNCHEGAFRSTAYVSLLPKEIKINYYSNPSVSHTIKYGETLPSHDSICLSATRNFMPSTYKWRYQDPNTKQWHDFPSNLRYSDNGATVTFTGKQLFPDFNKVLGEKIKFFINTPSAERQDTLVLEAVNSAPHIRSVKEIMPPCVGDSAGIEIHFDRKLETSERLEIYINDTLQGALQQNSKVFKFNVKAGRRGKITLKGTKEIYSIISIVPPFFSPENNALKDSYTNTVQIDTALSQAITKHEKETTIDVVSSKSKVHTKIISLYTRGDRHTSQFKAPPSPTQIDFTASITHVACHGGSNGEIVYQIKGGTKPYTATLTDSVQNKTPQDTESQAIFTGLKAGEYTLNIKDHNDCPFSGKTTIEQPDKAVTMEKDNIIITSPLGYNSSDGKINVKVEGGSGKYTFLIKRMPEDNTVYRGKCKKNGLGDYEFKGIRRGQYRIMAMDSCLSNGTKKADTDIEGCFAQQDIVVTAPELLTVTLEATKTIACFGNEDGIITAKAKGGVKINGISPYKYTWYKKVTKDEEAKEVTTRNYDSILRNLDSGSYYVCVTDQNGISVTSAPLRLQTPKALDVTLREEKRPSCGKANGAISASITGGTEPYKYMWTQPYNKTWDASHEDTWENAPSNAQLLRENIDTSTYSLGVIDNNGCEAHAEHQLTLVDPPKLKGSTADAKCYGNADGSIELTPEGGTAPYSFQWSDGTTTQKRFGLKAGEYQVELRDSDGCILRQKYNIKQPEELRVSLGDHITICSGQTRTLKALNNAHGVANYLWFYNMQKMAENTSQITVEKAGRYGCMVVDKNGCSAEANINVQVSSIELTLAIAMSSVVSINIPIHAVNISRIEAERVEWILPEGAQEVKTSDREAVFTIPTPGQYTLTAIGYKNGCSTSYEHALEVVEHALINQNDKTSPLIRQFEILPNPNNGRFRAIVGLSRPENFTLTLYSAKPSVIDKREGRMSQEGDFEFLFSNQPEGVYLLELRVGTQKAVQKIIKTR